jgi:hypothetical protein
MHKRARKEYFVVPPLMMCWPQQKKKTLPQEQKEEEEENANDVDVERRQKMCCVVHFRQLKVLRRLESISYLVSHRLFLFSFFSPLSFSSPFASSSQN